MSNQTDISVVIATYNGADFVLEQLESIERQTRPPAEIIVSDDASTDDTLKIVREFARGSNTPLRIIENKQNLGFRDNFLIGALAARSEFVAFCDQDDIWDSQKLELCSRYLGNRSISLIVHTARSVDTSNRSLGKFSQGIKHSCVKPPLSYDPWLTFFGFSMIFRRDLLELWDVFDRFVDFIVPSENIAHDRWVMFLAQVVGQTAEIDVPLVRYRQHDKNLFGDGRRRRRESTSAIIKSLGAYKDATATMIKIVSNLPDTTVHLFPLFDRSRALAFLSRALEQLERREAVYNSATRAEALGRIWSASTSGIYRSVHDGSLRWRSIARDLKFALIRR